MNEPSNRLIFSILPVWEQIEKARGQCDLFLKNRNFSNDVRDAVCMVLAELLENAVKYGTFSTEKEIVPITIEIDNETVFLSVESPLEERDANDERMKRLDAIIQWIRSYQAPFQAYLERLKIVAARDLSDEESGLGLVRIAYEGEAVVDFYVDESQRLTISAVYTLPKNDSKGENYAK